MRRHLNLFNQYFFGTSGIKDPGEYGYQDFIDILIQGYSYLSDLHRVYDTSSSSPADVDPVLTEKISQFGRLILNSAAKIDKKRGDDDFTRLAQFLISKQGLIGELSGYRYGAIKPEINFTEPVARFSTDNIRLLAHLDWLERQISSSGSPALYHSISIEHYADEKGVYHKQSGFAHSKLTFYFVDRGGIREASVDLGSKNATDHIGDRIHGDAALKTAIGAALKERNIEDRLSLDFDADFLCFGLVDPKPSYSPTCVHALVQALKLLGQIMRRHDDWVDKVKQYHDDDLLALYHNLERDYPAFKSAMDSAFRITCASGRLTRDQVDTVRRAIARAADSEDPADYRLPDMLAEAVYNASGAEEKYIKASSTVINGEVIFLASQLMPLVAASSLENSPSWAGYAINNSIEAKQSNLVNEQTDTLCGQLYICHNGKMLSATSDRIARHLSRLIQKAKPENPEKIKPR